MRPLPRNSPFNTDGRAPLGKSPEPRAEDRALEDKAFDEAHTLPPLTEGAWKAAEDRIRTAKTPPPEEPVASTEAEEARERRIREVLERDRIDAPAKGARVLAYAPEGSERQQGAVLCAVAFRPSTDTWVAEVLVERASRTRIMVLKRILGGWEEVLA